jgi:DNA-directed RNA polymerase specialized sigma24 family protein
MAPSTADCEAVRKAAHARLRGFGHEMVREHAEDLAQDVTLAYVVAADRETIDNPAAWGNRAAGNAALKFIRDHKAPQPDAEDTERAVQQFIVHGRATSDMAMIKQQAGLLMAQLDEREREFVTLVALGYSQAEIADTMGYAGADSVKATLHRKRAMLLGIAEEAGLEVDWQDHPRVY